MKINVRRLAIVLLAILITDCGKKNTGTSGNQTSTGFIDFKIDGTHYHIDDFNSNAGNGTVTYSTTLSLSLYQAIIVFYTASATGASNISLQQISHSPLKIKNYAYTTFNVNEYPTLVFVLPNLYSYSVTTASTGNVNITRIGTTSGGKIEGKFNFDNMIYSDNNSNLISSNHSLTEGTFSVVVD